MPIFSSNRRRAGTILLFIILLIVLGIVFSGKREGATGGSDIPDYVLKDYRSELHDSSELLGKVVAILFWKVSVQSSVAELKGLDQLSEKYGSRDFEAIGISLDEGGDKFLKGFRTKHRVGILLLSGNVETAHLFGGLRGVPTTFIFDRDGKLVDILEGFRGEADLEERITELL